MAGQKKNHTHFSQSVKTNEYIYQDITISNISIYRNIDVSISVYQHVNLSVYQYEKALLKAI